MWLPDSTGDTGTARTEVLCLLGNSDNEVPGVQCL
jgi:hypothetical protein